MPKKPAKKASPKKAEVAEKRGLAPIIEDAPLPAPPLLDQPETVAGFPVLRHPDVPADSLYVLPSDVADRLDDPLPDWEFTDWEFTDEDGAALTAAGWTISTIVAPLPPRGDEERIATVSLIADANGTDSALTIVGAGVGGHICTTRVWPDDQYHRFEFDGDTFMQTHPFVATHAIVTIDDGDEIRVGTVPTDRKDPDNG